MLTSFSSSIVTFQKTTSILFLSIDFEMIVYTLHKLDIFDKLNKSSIVIFLYYESDIMYFNCVKDVIKVLFHLVKLIISLIFICTEPILHILLYCLFFQIVSMTLILSYERNSTNIFVFKMLFYQWGVSFPNNR